MHKIDTKPPEDPKTASHQEPLWNLSKSAHRAHTLHTCSSRKRFFKMKAEQTILSRDRVQNIQLWVHNFDSRTGFVICFESITKQERQAQNGPL